MNIYITGLGSGYEVEHLVRLFYPMAPLTLTPPEDGADCVWAEKRPDKLWAMVRQGGKSQTAEAPLPIPVEEGGETPEFALASLTYDLLRSWTGIRPPWGKMTGVRPVRLVHDKRAAGWTEEEIDDFFLKRFDCSPEKYGMAKAIADLQEPILKVGSAPKTYSLYIGIPFCPSRCSYCSFVSCNLDRDRKLVQPYVDCLCKEVEAIRDEADKAGLTLCSIYIGGGTPTTLEPEELERLFLKLQNTLDWSQVREFTVEAGRADSITAEKLRVMKRYGVTRISVNPQTMKQETLDLIGRRHTVAQTVEAFRLAREEGFDNINMDLILGLPGETKEDVEETIRRVQELGPDSLTVHSLAIKRASRLSQWILEHGISTLHNTDKTMAIAAQGAKQMGMEPYYLYRQKNMSGNFENVGYAKPEKAGIYNILIMEEVQTIMALGAGTISKRVYGDGRIERCDNVKDVGQYIERIDEMIQRKQRLFSEE